MNYTQNQKKEPLQLPFLTSVREPTEPIFKAIEDRLDERISAVKMEHPVTILMASIEPYITGLLHRNYAVHGP